MKSIYLTLSIGASFLILYILTKLLMFTGWYESPVGVWRAIFDSWYS
ncbi:hypothetical protein [Vibrio genomosp. F10]|nr:hypothetical protein [Vibrio genomosp. F10]